MSRKFFNSRVLHFWFCSFLYSTGLMGQATVDKQIFTVKDGLSENVVHSLFQDGKGFLWIGTHEGLNRYDGYSFKKFLHDKNDSTSLPNSPVERLFEDEQGDFIVSTTSVLAKMDKTTHHFQTVKMKGYEYSDRKNRAFVSSRPGVKPYFNVDFIWFNVSTKDLPLSDLQKTYLEKSERLSAYFDAKKRLWILEPGKLFVIDQQGLVKLIHAGIFLENNAFPISAGLFNDSNGNMWLRVKGKLFCIDMNSLTLKTTIFQSQLEELPIENIQAALLDRSGVLWLGSFYGLMKLNLNPQPFSHFTFTEKEGLVNNFVLGLNIHSGDKLSVQHYYLDSFYSEIDLSTNAIRRFRIKDVPIEKYLKDVLLKFHHPPDNEYLKRQSKRLEELAYLRGSIRYLYSDRESVVWTIYSANNLSNLNDKRVVSVGGSTECLWDDKNFLWIATTTQGLIRYRKSNGDLKAYRYNANKSKYISSDNLLCLTPDKKGNFWIGTRAGGLNYFDKEKETFTHFTESDGLSSNTIYCMVVDDSNNLWMGTAKGLSCLEYRSGVFRNFYTANGLMNTEFNRWSAVKDSKGILYFGGMNGIDYFKPADVLKIRDEPPIVHLTAFKTGQLSQPLQQGLALHHKQNFISFEFAAMDFRNPAATQFIYQLQGASNDWINAEGNHTAVFAALPPGKYVFKVKAATQNGVWGSENSLAFSIRAPWWQQGWFYALCGIVIAGLLYSFYSFRINQLKKVLTVRTRISQDLHDDVGASLSSIHIYSSVAEKELDTDPAKAKAILQKINVGTRNVMENMSDIIWALHPGQHDEKSFASRIKNYGYDLLSQKNIECVYKIDLHAEKKLLRPEARKNILLIVKEALNNIAKYSEATRVEVNIRAEKKSEIVIAITDNGKGFDTATIKNGNGLKNMEQRTVSLGGSLSIKSAPGEGSVIQCIIPLTKISDR